MPLTIFYSWQSDTPNAMNRGFIEDCLVKAIKSTVEKIVIQNAIRDEEIRLDKDTQGVPGTPPIVETIFNKIDSCLIFLPDLTFIGQSPDGRMLPNPNVLIEYGWALKSISYSRIIPVMNTAFGAPTNDNMPFDMRHLRNPITYFLSADSNDDEKADAKKKLIKALSDAIEAIVKSRVVEHIIRKPHIVEAFSFENPSRFCSENEPFAVISNSTGTDNRITIPNTESLFLRIIPVNQVKATESTKKAYELMTAGQLTVMGRNDRDNYRYSSGRNKYGAYMCRYKEDKAVSLTQLFLSRQLWGVDLDLINKTNIAQKATQWGMDNVDFGFFPSVAIEEVFNKALERYMKFAVEYLELSMPLKFIAGATGVEGYRMTVNTSGFPHFDGSVINQNIFYEGEILDYKQKTTEILRPFFNHIWNECGLDRPNVEVLR